jgi:hypothetical protein
LAKRKTTSTAILDQPRPTTDPDLDPPGDGVSSAAAVDSSLRPRGRVAEIASELADAGLRGAKKVTKANEKDWEEFLAVFFGYLSLLLVWFLLAGSRATRAQREEFELSEAEAEGIARPASRILARSWINARWGKHILGGSDYIVLAIVLTEYGERIAPLFRAKLEQMNPLAHRQPQRSSQSARRSDVVEEPGRPQQPRPVNAIWPASAT